MSVIEARAVRDDLARAAEAAGAYPEGRFAGRGLVVSAGGPRMLTNAYVLVRTIREIHGSTLPIELWHAGPAEIPDVTADILQGLGCRLVDGLADGAAIHDGWHLKVCALIDSSFEQVLLLDADQVPLIDPAAVFDWPEFAATGAVFWPDVIDLSETNPVWPLLGLAPRRVRSWDSGQLCIDKRRCWQPLAVARRMNERADLFYRLVYGDKDTFLAAWALTGAERAVVPHPPLRDPRYLAQRDFAGAVVFQHRTNCKFDLLAPPMRPGGFVLQAECEAMLHDLRRVWNGRAFQAPARSAAARHLEGDLVANGRFELAEDGKPPAAVELLPGHQIGEGRSDTLANWHVEDAEGALRIVLHDIAGPWARLARDAGGAWRGRAPAGTDRDVRLAPAGATRTPPAAPPRTLTDDLLQVALASPGPPDLARLEAALGFVAHLEADAAARVRARAALLAGGFPALAADLRALADRLSPPRAGRDMRARPDRHPVLGDPDRYMPPRALPK